MKHDRDNQTKTLVHCLMISYDVGPQTLKIGPGVSPSLREFCILLHCHSTILPA